MEAALKKDRSWTALTVMKDVYRKLESVRRRKARAFQMKLSWTKFFSLVLPELEKKADQRS